MAIRRATPFAAALLIALASIAGVAPSAVAADDGRTDTAATTYTLDAERGVINVSADLKVTNTTPNTTESYACVKYTYDAWLGSTPYMSTCTGTVRSYFTGTSVWIEREATNFRATTKGGSVTVTRQAPGTWFRRVDLRFPNLYYGQTRTLHVTYTIPGASPRSANPTRATRAYANFCVYSHGYDAGTVSVHLPAGFKVTFTGATLNAGAAGKEQTFSSGSIADPTTWWSCLEGANDSGYAVKQLAAQDGRPVILESWPEDTQWATAVRSEVQTDLPSLIRLVGHGMSGSAPLVIKETVTGGEYAGFYDPGTNTITVDEHFDQPALVGHELAHVWFNDALFTDTWLSEGYAEWAGRTVEHAPPPCTVPSATGGPRPNLSSWQYINPKSTDEERAAVDFEYDASCYVVTAIANAAGSDRMTGALQAMLDGVDPYGIPASTASSTTSTSSAASVAHVDHAVTWRQWLDSVDELALQPAGVSPTLASELLLAYGATSDRSTLLARSAARTAYHALMTQTSGWTVPEAVRSPLRSWEFAAAQAAITAASPAWTLTGQTDNALAGVDARHGPVARAWADAKSTADLLAATELARKQLDAATEVAAADALAKTPLDVVQQVGLLGQTVPDIAPAVAAVRSIDTTEASRVAGDVRGVIEGARSAGEIRIIVTSVVVIGGALVLVAFVIRRRRAARALERSMAAQVLALSTAAAAVADEAPVVAEEPPAVAEVEQGLTAAEPDAPAAAPHAPAGPPAP